MLKEEFYTKNLFGVMMATVQTPVILMESEDATDLSKVNKENLEQAMADYKQKALDGLLKNPLLKPRFFDMFDEMKTRGLFESVL